MNNDKGQQSKTKKMLDAMLKVSGDEVIEKTDKKDNSVNNTRNPDYRVTKQNPYGGNSWLFAGLKK